MLGLLCHMDHRCGPSRGTAPAGAINTQPRLACHSVHGFHVIRHPDKVRPSATYWFRAETSVMRLYSYWVPQIRAHGVCSPATGDCSHDIVTAIFLTWIFQRTTRTGGDPTKCIGTQRSNILILKSYFAQRSGVLSHASGIVR